VRTYFIQTRANQLIVVPRKNMLVGKRRGRTTYPSTIAELSLGGLKKMCALIFRTLLEISA